MTTLPFADLAPAVTGFLSGVLVLNSETSMAMMNAELYLYFGGVAMALTLCCFSMAIRATKAAGRDIDL